MHFEADFLWKVSLKILNSGIILKTFTHVAIKGMMTCFQHAVCVTTSVSPNEQRES